VRIDSQPDGVPLGMLDSMATHGASAGDVSRGQVPSHAFYY
jgi:hypothetical protein